LAQASIAQPTGRVVINEYMPWTSNACGVKTEFVELLNFGPGPVNIGCYILTTGVYSVTIPPNTVLQPGQYYVLGGADVLQDNCANVDSSGKGIRTNLNWNTCNCTNIPIPTANNSEGMMADDGYSPLVLLDPSLNVVDAVVRNLQATATSSITSASTNGCASKTFNIGTMNINYELLGMAPGNQNSYARTLDGDCVWLKQPQSTGNASNRRDKSISDITYQFDMVNPTVCGSEQGSVSIYVKHSNYASIFPMTYTIVKDATNNGFDMNDLYTTDTAYTPPFIEINDLPIGRYRVTVASAKGCYLQSFDFSITTCNPGTLLLRLVYFRNEGVKNGRPQLEWLLQDVQDLQTVVVQKSSDGETFITENLMVNKYDRGTKLYSQPVNAGSDYPYYRLKIIQKNGQAFYSPVINTATNHSSGINKLWPNPATNRLNIELAGGWSQAFCYTLNNSNGLVVGKGLIQKETGGTTGIIPLPATLPPGVYHLQVSGASGTGQPISFRFVKQ
jgi:hypothetical protein